ncbi:MAG: hypothetical protein K2Z81_21180, partial [Cyanobacteria bacterium]|nr:hypothetical protein [Cyanobacteriota bacterium]
MDNSSTLSTVYYSLAFTQVWTIGGFILACNSGTEKPMVTWLPASMSPYSALIIALLSIALILTTVTGPAVKIRNIRKVSLAISVFCQLLSALLLAHAFR